MGNLTVAMMLFSSLTFSWAQNYNYCPSLCQCYNNPTEFTNCSNAGLEDVPDTIIANVKKLDISDNEIKKLNWPKRLTDLEEVNLSNNSLTSAKFPTTLKIIDLSYNLFEDTKNIEISKLASLDRLILKGNDQITKIFLENNNLGFLDLSFCNLQSSTIDNSDAKLPKIKTLLLSNNNLHKFPRFLTNDITTLDLSYNNIKHLFDLSTVKSLKKLNMTHNKDLHLKLFQSGLDVEEVDFSKCSMSNFVISSLSQLTKADFSDNSLDVLNQTLFRNATHLRHLNLSANKLTQIETNAFVYNGNITFLDVSRNSISTVDWTHTLRQLVILNVSENQISVIEHLYLPKATYADFSKNQITQIKIDLKKDLPSIQTIHLNGNKFEKGLKPLTSGTLEILDLGYCEIMSLEPITFLGLTKLMYLNIEGNKLTHLDVKVFQSSLLHIKMGHNPWDCNCGKEEFRNLYVYLLKNKSLVDEQSLTCDDGNTWTSTCFIPPGVAPSHFETFLGVASLFMCIVFAIGLILYCKARKAKTRSPEEIGRISTDTQVTSSSTAPLRQMRRSHSAAEMGYNRVTLQQSADHPANAPPPSYEEALLLPQLTETERMTRSMDVLRNS